MQSILNQPINASRPLGRNGAAKRNTLTQRARDHQSIITVEKFGYTDVGNVSVDCH